MRLKEIKDFKDRYMVSDDGRIFSLRDFSGRKRFIEKKQYTDKYGYKCCMLYKNGEKKHVTIHRVVATAFLENKENYPQVNHIDGNKSNNMVSNLEWCTASYNVQHSYDNGLNIPHESPWKECKSSEHPRAKKVKAEKEGKVMIFNSGIEASLFFNVCKQAVATAIHRGNKCKGWNVAWMRD